MKITLKEIAARVGVAESTVSRVLSKEPTLSISDQKRRAIIETAEELNYVRVGRRSDPKLSQQNLGRIVLVHELTIDEELSRPYFVGLRKGIEAAALEHGASLLRTGPKLPLSIETSEQLLGCIVIGKLPEETLAEVIQLDLPLVFADQPAPDSAHDSVVADIDRAMLRLLDLIAQRGHDRIACVDLIEPSDSLAIHGRGRIYRQWSEARNLFDPDYLITGFRPSSGRQLTRTLLKTIDAAGKPLPNALIATTDAVAAEAYQAIAERGLRIPEDIAVVGTNDSSIAQLLVPPLSTIEIPAGDMGRTALELLLERCAGRQVTKTVTLHTTFVERKSLRTEAAPAIEHVEGG